MKRVLILLLLAVTFVLAQQQANTEQAGWLQSVNQWTNLTSGCTLSSPSSEISPDTLYFADTDSLVLGPLKTWPYLDLEITFADSVSATDSLVVDSIAVYQSNYTTFSTSQYVMKMTLYDHTSTSYTSFSSLGTYGNSFARSGEYRPARYFWLVIHTGTNNRALSGNYAFVTVLGNNPEATP